MKHFQWWILSGWIRRAGRTELAGIGLIVFFVMFQFSVNAPMRKNIDILQHEAGKNIEGEASGFKRVNIVSLKERFDEFYRYFPPRQSVPDWLGKIYNAAAMHSIRLDQGEYKLVTNTTLKLLEYKISLPVNGSYVQVKKFVAQVLNEVPTIALEELNFKREGVNTTEIKAMIVMTIYVRAI
jgi:hypothetical protein